MKSYVPEHEDEVIKAAIAQQSYRDDEKIPTTAVKKYITPDGIVITSRYQKAHEINQMAAAVDKMDKVNRHGIISIWCDTKACADYRIEVRDDISREFGRIVGVAFCEALPGYNGVSVTGKNFDDDVWFDPEWYECD